MKILYEFEYCGPQYVSEGYRKVFQSLGHDFHYWIPKQKPAFDIFGEYEPDLFMGRSFTLDQAIYKCIANRPNMRVILYASAWGDLINQIDLTQYPIVAINDKEKARLEKLKKETGKPDFVWLHYADAWVDRTLGGWRSIGIEPVGLLNASDTFDYLNGEYKPHLACDVGFVGGYWGYKARNLDRYMLPICHSDLGLKVKIFGNQPWPVAQHLGLCENSTARDLFRSALVCPNVSEPHSTSFGFDIIERPFKVLSSGGFCVSDYVQSMEEEVFKNNEIPTAKSSAEFIEKVVHFVEHPEERIPYMERGYETVLGKHTYFDRVAKIFDQLGMTDEASRTIQLKDKLLFNSENVYVS